MHNVIFGPICLERIAYLWVEHWTIAPDIEALAVATAVLDKTVTSCDPVTSVTFWNTNGSQGSIKSRAIWLMIESQGIVGELTVQRVTPLPMSISRLQVSEIRSPTHAKSWPLIWFGVVSSVFIAVEACRREMFNFYTDINDIIITWKFSWFKKE